MIRAMKLNYVHITAPRAIHFRTIYNNYFYCHYYLQDGFRNRAVIKSLLFRCSLYYVCIYDSRRMKVPFSLHVLRLQFVVKAVTQQTGRVGLVRRFLLPIFLENHWLLWCWMHLCELLKSVSLPVVENCEPRVTELKGLVRTEGFVECLRFKGK